jgi:hypothetical protein
VLEWRIRQVWMNPSKGALSGPETHRVTSTRHVGPHPKALVGA